MRLRNIKKEIVYMEPSSSISTDQSNKEQYDQNTKRPQQKQNTKIIQLTQQISKKGISRQQELEKGRIQAVIMFSKLQKNYALRYETLFLASNILHHYLKKTHQIPTLKDGLVSLMIALKYEQIYPVCLDQISKDFGVLISRKQYIRRQQIVLQKLNYNLKLQNPYQYFTDPIISQIYQHESTKYYLLYFLELSMFNNNIINNYTWKQIIDSIVILFTQSYKHEKISNEKLEKCAKILCTEMSSTNPKYLSFHQKYQHIQYGKCSYKQIPKLNRKLK